MREQVNIAYGGGDSVNNRIPTIQNVLNQTRLVFNKSERKAISNVRNAGSEVSPQRNTYYPPNNNVDRDRIRRGGGGITKQSQDHPKFLTNMINRSSQRNQLNYMQ